MHGSRDAAWLEAVSEAREENDPANAEVFSDGDICTSFLIVLRGAIRVNQVLENGRELVLYHVQTGFRRDLPRLACHIEHRVIM